MRIRVTEAIAISRGEMRAFDVAGTMVNVARVADHLYAFEDRCTHMGCSLAKGELRGTVVTCRCHGSQFDVTSGAVLRGPAVRPVRPVPFAIENGQVVVDAATVER